jgi:uncharacterized protein
MWQDGTAERENCKRIFLGPQWVKSRSRHKPVPGETWINPVATDLRVEWRDSADDIPAELWKQCFRPPLEGRWLYATLEQSGLEEQFTFAYALVMREQSVIALAPVFTTILPISIIAPDFISGLLKLGGPLTRRLRFQKTLFVGSPCSDEGNVGTLPGVRLADVAPTLQKALWDFGALNGCASVAWKDFPQSAWPALRGLVRDAGLCEVDSYPGTLIPDIGRHFDEYLRGLSVKQRHNLRKKLRLSKNEINLTAEIVSDADDDLIEEIWPLFQNTYNKSTIKFERLTKRFWKVVAAQPQTRLILLREAGEQRAVAFMLVGLEGERAINKYIGIDYSLGTKSFLYFRLWEEFLQWATRIGAHGVQCGQTSYEAKLDLGHELVPLKNFFRYRNPLIHWIAALVARHITWGTLDETLRRRLGSPRRNARTVSPGAGAR